MADADVRDRRAWVSPLDDVGPAPGDGALEIVVECRTVRRRRGRQHPVVIGPDWSLSTPHDLEAERVAVALGGYLSCLLLADQVVPAVRTWTQLLARRRLADLTGSRTGAWTAVGCRCSSRSFQGADGAARHAREEHHWAYLAREVPVRLLAQVAEAVRSAHPPSTWEIAGEHPAWPRVREPHGPADLWRAGVPPELVVEIHDALGAADPLPVRLYVAAAYRRPSYSWLREILDVTGDPDVTTWCAETITDSDRRTPELRLTWLRLGLPRRDVEALSASDYGLADAEQGALLMRCGVRRAAIVLAEWHRAGCCPSPTQAFASLGFGSAVDRVPTAAAIDAVLRRAQDLRPLPTRTEAGLALVAAGTVPQALHHLITTERGTRMPRE